MQSILYLRRQLKNLDQAIVDSCDLAEQRAFIGKRDAVNIQIGMELATGEKGIFIPELMQDPQLLERDPCIEDAEGLLLEIGELTKESEALDRELARAKARKSPFAAHR